AMAAGAPISPEYCAMIEELLSVAEAEYALALEVVPRLPASFARPVAVAAYLYRGIHAEIREQKYDNLNRRAYTTPFTKARLAMMALWELHRGSRSGPLAPLFQPPRIGP